MGSVIAYPQKPSSPKPPSKSLRAEALRASKLRAIDFGSWRRLIADRQSYRIGVRGNCVLQGTDPRGSSDRRDHIPPSAIQLSSRAEIDLHPGHRPTATDEAIEILQERGDLYERSGELVRVCGNHMLPVDENWLIDYLARHIRFFRFKQNGDNWIRREADPPSWLAKVIIAKTGERGLQELTGVITAPTLRPDGSLMDQPGFDPATGLLLQAADWPSIPLHPDPAQLRRAWNVLWRPFLEFPFASCEDCGATVAAILTATVRRTLPRAPAISFDAPSAGSGKTLLATCIAELAGGEVAVVPECRDEEELRKRLLSSLRAGQPSILLDNVKGQFASSALEAFLTDDKLFRSAAGRFANGPVADQRAGSNQRQQLPAAGRSLEAYCHHANRPESRTR